MTVGERQSNLLSGETGGTQAGLTWDHSLKKNAVSNLNPQSHSIPPYQPHNLLPKTQLRACATLLSPLRIKSQILILAF